MCVCFIQSASLPRTRGETFRCASPVQPDRSSSSSLFANTAVPLCTCIRGVVGRVALKSSSASSSFLTALLCNRLLHGNHPVDCVGQLLLELLNLLLLVAILAQAISCLQAIVAVSACVG